MNENEVKKKYRQVDGMYRFNYSAKDESKTMEIHLGMDTLAGNRMGDINLKMASTIIDALQIKAQLVGYYEDPATQPIFLN